jgi:[CysO sulfur-carrier protein]-S-L-cysteine hydrolase
VPGVIQSEWRVRIPKVLATELVAHCDAERPNEACGVLAMDGSDVVQVFPMKNADKSPVRYRLEPNEQLRVYQELDHHGWGFASFHSHTRTEAFPSPTDVKEAREDVPYVIVSLAADEPDIKAFRIVKKDWLDLTGEIQEVPVEVVG